MTETSTTASPRRLVEKASPGVHTAAFEALQRYCRPPARIADLGAGTGAWSRRLAGAGYGVVPVDTNKEEWAVPELPLIDRDLNEPFADHFTEAFDAVTSLEVIEHLENPRLFLRQCRLMIKDEGVILLTTPNIENVAGRIRFFLTGQFRGFDRDPRWNEPTHITPSQTYMFEKMCATAQLRVAWHGFAHAAETTVGRHKRLLFAGLRPFVRGTRGGDHHVFVLKRCLDQSSEQG